MQGRFLVASPERSNQRSGWLPTGALHYAGRMDDLNVTLSALDRLEAERRLRTMPRAIVESAWALESQTEAVVDALLAAWGYAAPETVVHARHVGEWAARIATELPRAPSPGFMRRCGVLANLNPAIIEKLPEVRDCAPVVDAFQRLRMCVRGASEVRTAALIVATADEFDTLAFGADANRCVSPLEALRVIMRCADEESHEVVQALVRAARATHVTSLAATA